MKTMRVKHLPVLWLMTDAARGDAERAIAALPHGAGIVFRHYGVADREALARRWRRLAAQRGLVFLVAGDHRLAARLGADGFHAPEALAHRLIAARRLMPQGLFTAAAHGAPGLAAAARAGADAVFLSPVFATVSHPGAPTLGPLRFAALARQAGRPVIALGGMDAGRFGRLTGAYGFAAISAFQRARRP